ncbi:MAG: hypothetical protein AABY89_10025 [Acidobacteriota bacterium]
MFRFLPIALVLAASVALAAACGGKGDDLSRLDAAAALRASPSFTMQIGAPIGRELVDVVAVRRIGLSSTEVEFTWHDAAVPSSQPAPLRTSMALFRMQEDRRWVLTSLYKVN